MTNPPVLLKGSRAVKAPRPKDSERANRNRLRDFFRYARESSSESAKKIAGLNDANVSEGLQLSQMAIAGNDQLSSAG